jgi:CheY-like chemotaxis protein
MTQPEPLLLVIEDEPQMLRFLRASLGAHGYRLVESTTARDGLAQAASRTPDVILLDLGLPDGDGIDVTARLREWSRIPVIVISARGQDEDKIRALDAGRGRLPHEALQRGGSCSPGSAWPCATARRWARAARRSRRSRRATCGSTS